MVCCVRADSLIETVCDREVQVRLQSVFVCAHALRVCACVLMHCACVCGACVV